MVLGLVSGWIVAQVGDSNFDTWGIAGPTFLRAYVAAIIGSVLVALTARYVLLSRPSRWATEARSDLPQLDPYQLADLKGGAELVVILAQVQQLRRAAHAPRKNAPTVAEHPVEEAVKRVRKTLGKKADPKAVRALARKQNEVTAVVDDLVRRGLVLSSAAIGMLRALAVLPGMVVVLGVVRVVAGIYNNKPVGYLIPLVVLAIAAAVAVAVLGSRTAPASTLGRRILTRDRSNGHDRSQAKKQLAADRVLDDSALRGLAVGGKRAIADASLTTAAKVGALGVMASAAVSGRGGGGDSAGDFSSSCASSSSCGGGGGGGGCGG